MTWRRNSRGSGPRDLEAPASVSTRILAVTWPIWIPLAFLGLGVYLVCALIVLLVKLAWGLIQVLGGER